MAFVECVVIENFLAHPSTSRILPATLVSFRKSIIVLFPFRIMGTQFRVLKMLCTSGFDSPCVILVGSNIGANGAIGSNG